MSLKCGLCGNISPDFYEFTKHLKDNHSETCKGDLSVVSDRTEKKQEIDISAVTFALYFVSLFVFALAAAIELYVF